MNESNEEILKHVRFVSSGVDKMNDALHEIVRELDDEDDYFQVTAVRALIVTLCAVWMDNLITADEYIYSYERKESREKLMRVLNTGLDHTEGESGDKVAKLKKIFDCIDMH